MSGEQAIFNLQIKKKSGLSLNPDIHHSKVFSSELFKNAAHFCDIQEFTVLNFFLLTAQK